LNCQKCLVDIGSACTSIRRRVATKPGLEIEAGNTVLTTFLERASRV
jgi:hypothetical protein